MSIANLFGSIAFVTSVIGLLPQVIKSIQTKSTQDVSMLMLINYAVCSIAWIVYGSSTGSFFVLMSNVLGIISALILIWLKLVYDERGIKHVTA